MTIAATSCRKQMPDPAFYAKCLQNSFDEMKAATLGGSKIGKPAGPGRSLIGWSVFDRDSSIAESRWFRRRSPTRPNIVIIWGVSPACAPA